MNEILIPLSSPVPLSSPAWLFLFFLVLTFFIHILFVNLTLGGSILILISRYIGKNYGKDSYNRVAEEIGYLNTFNISMTITTGVAPLLFIQTIYENFFYTSSILLSWKWLFVLVSIILAYYFYYIYKFKPFGFKNTGGRGIIFIIFATIFFIYVAMIFVGNTLSSMQPEIWKDIYLGKRSFMSANTYFPRLLHFLLGTIAIAGIFLMFYSKIKKSLNQDVKESMYRLGKGGFFVATLLNIAVGLWFLYSHEAKIFNLLMGNNLVGTALLWISLLLAVIVVIFINKIPDTILMTIALVIVAFMTIVRRVVEDGYFAKYIDVYALKVEPYWGIFAIFAILFVALLITLYYGFLRVYKDIKGI